ncbi:cysteine peptidase family C39 domain-containing protein [Erysipelothrix sp. D19-032]
MFKRFKHTQDNMSLAIVALLLVSTILKSYHVCVSYGDIKEAVETDRTGTRLNLISEYFKSLGFTTCMIRTQISELTPRLTYPILIHVYLENPCGTLHRSSCNDTSK